jgi:transketolase
MKPTYEEALKSIAVSNEAVIVMTAENRAAIRNLPAALGERFVDVGICEQTMVAAAAGLALRGRIPVIHALAAFLTLRAFEFIRTDIGITGLPVKMIGGVPGFLSEANGPTHQSLEDVGLMRSIPGMQIFCPADRQELVESLPKIIDSDSPCYVRFNSSEPAHAHNAGFEIGKAEILSEGTDVTLLVYGFLVREALRAQRVLESQGVSVRLLNMRSLEPIDAPAIIDSARQTTLLVTIEDHFLRGGLYSIVCELLIEHGTLCSVLPFAFNQRWFKPALLDDALHYEGFCGERIAERILESLRTKGGKGCQTPYNSMTVSRIRPSPMTTTPER